MVKNILFSTKKASKVNKKNNPLQAVSEKRKKKLNFYFNEYN